MNSLFVFINVFVLIYYRLYFFNIVLFYMFVIKTISSNCAIIHSLFHHLGILVFRVFVVFFTYTFLSSSSLTFNFSLSLSHRWAWSSIDFHHVIHDLMLILIIVIFNLKMFNFYFRKLFWFGEVEIRFGFRSFCQISWWRLCIFSDFIIIELHIELCSTYGTVFVVDSLCSFVCQVTFHWRGLLFFN